MKLFRKNTDVATVTDKAARSIAGIIIKSNNLFGNYLNKITGKWQHKHQRHFFFTIIILFCGCNIFMLINSFRNSNAHSLSVPKSISATKSINLKAKVFLITDDEIQKVREYKSNHPDLSIDNPVLYDSLLLIEQVYSSQLK